MIDDRYQYNTEFTDVPRNNNRGAHSLLAPEAVKASY